MLLLALKGPELELRKAVTRLKGVKFKCIESKMASVWVIF